MFRESLAEIIKATRAKYGLSQRSFATLLGIGEATMVRYEQGAVPSRANANLILAAEDPRFMLGCIERNGAGLSERQRARAEKYVYEVVSLDADEGQGESKMDEMYRLTLRQEVLNEKAADIVCMLIRHMSEKGVSPDDTNDPLVVLIDQLFEIKGLIIGMESRNDKTLDEIAGYLQYLGQYVEKITGEQRVA
jgi:HTH-type transcriptional regulator/antitoxin PezA